MDFGHILDDWERLSARPGGLDKAAEAEKRLKEEESRKRAQRREEEAKEAPSPARDSLASWLDTYGTMDKDAPESGASERELRVGREAEAKRLKAKRPEASIDLHGLREAEAEASLSTFLEDAARRGLEKVLVITGKGLHSQGEPILGRVARRVIEASPYAGRFGAAEAADGGSGALWVLVRRGNHFSR